MPAHVIYDAVDSAPAGFSARWINLLRSRLDFTGAVFSDDLLMEGASGQGTMPDRAAAALKAGCDLVLVCNRTDAMDEVLDGLAWKAGPRYRERIDRIVPRDRPLDRRASRQARFTRRPCANQKGWPMPSRLGSRASQST